MKNLWIAASNVSMWLSVAAAIIYAVYRTGSWFPLFFMLIPAFCGICIFGMILSKDKEKNGQANKSR